MKIKKVQAGIWSLTNGSWGFVEMIGFSDLPIELIVEIRRLSKLTRN